MHEGKAYMWLQSYSNHISEHKKGGKGDSVLEKRKDDILLKIEENDTHDWVYPRCCIPTKCHHQLR